MYNINKLKNAIAGAIVAPQYFRNALFSKDYAAGKATKEKKDHYIRGRERREENKMF